MKKILLVIILVILLSGASVATAATPDGATGPWADEVVNFTQGNRANGTPVLTERSNPLQALGPAEGTDTVNFVSLGFGGEIVLKFNNCLLNGNDNDIEIVETSYGSPSCSAYPEIIRIYASQDGSSWNELGTSCLDGSCDLGSLTWAKYIKLVDESDKTKFSGEADGFDIDGIKALHTFKTCPPCCGGDIIVKNINKAVVNNNVTAVANTGGNTVAGGNGGNGGIASKSYCQEHSVNVASDATNTVLETAGNAVPVSFIHSAWTASIPGATWIWAVDPVANPTQNEYSTFEKQFNVVGSVISAILDIASDNSYEVWINNIPVGADASENNFSLAGQDQYTASVVSALQSGTNTIKIKVKNWALGGGTPYTNPAGLLYKLVVNSEECHFSNANGGNGGSNSGSITTGISKTKSKVINVVNTNITRIRR